MSELLDRLRSELDDVTQTTVARVAVATFGRVHGRTGELVTVLKPTDEQREAAAVDHGPSSGRSARGHGNENDAAAHGGVHDDMPQNEIVRPSGSGQMH